MCQKDSKWPRVSGHWDGWASLNLTDVSDPFQRPAFPHSVIHATLEKCNVQGFPGFGVLALSICFCHLPGTGRAKATFPRSLCSLRSVSDGDSPNQMYFCESHLQNWAVCWVGWPASKGSFLTFTCWLVQFCDITLKVFPGNPHLIPWAT